VGLNEIVEPGHALDDRGDGSRHARWRQGGENDTSVGEAVPHEIYSKRAVN
jgi:hypothetical protein